MLSRKKEFYPTIQFNLKTSNGARVKGKVIVNGGTELRISDK
jgi:hypothetical protein